MLKQFAESNSVYKVFPNMMRKTSLLLYIAIFTCIPVVLITTTQSSQAFQVSNTNQYSLVHQAKYGSDFSVENIRGNSGTEIPVKVTLPYETSRAGSKKAWIRVIGMPEDLSFTKGTKINDIWFMPVNDMDGLALKSPNGFRGRFSVNFFLMRGKQSVVSIVGKKSIQIELFPAPKPKPKRRITSSVVPKRTISPPPQYQLKPIVEQTTMKRATQFIRMGDIGSARLLYEHIAVKGSALAAFSMGRTYDPQYLKGLVQRGLKADVKKARHWYEKAIDIGSTRVSFNETKPTFEVFLREYAKHLGFNAGRLTETQNQVLLNQYNLTHSNKSALR